MIKILVVDDEPGVCHTIEKAFSYIGFSVSTATTAAKAMLLFQKEKPKIVFLDLIIPDGDGAGLLRQMKAIDPGVIVIVVTAKKEEKIREEILSLGADEFIQKPFSRNYLRDVVVGKIHAVLDKGGHMQTPKILIADDEDQMRESLKHYIIPRFECSIEEAQDAQGALDKVRQTKPDIVFLDVKMPGLSGLEVIGQMKAFSPHSRIIVVSAWKSAEVVNKAISAGAQDYISKPVSLAALGDKLKDVLLSMGKLMVKNA